MTRIIENDLPWRDGQHEIHELLRKYYQIHIARLQQNHFIHRIVSDMLLCSKLMTEEMKIPTLSVKS